MKFKCLYVYYESPNICQRYFSQSLRSIRKLFNVDKLFLINIEKTKNLAIQDYSPYPCVILMNEHIKPSYNSDTYLDGIGLYSNNIALVKYQDAPFTDTMYLLAHEVGHLIGMPHCSSMNCLMGVYYKNGKAVYAWRRLCKQRKLSKRSFCSECRVFISQGLLKEWAVDA